MPLLVHGESTDPAIDVFDREKAFLEEVLGPMLERFPHLKVVLEHITTREAVQYVEVTGAERGRHDHRAPPAPEPQRAVPGRHPPAPLLPAGAQARGAPRGAGRGRDLRQPQVLPRHRQRAALARRQGSGLRLRRHLHRARRASSSTPWPSRKPARWSGWRASRAASARASTACRQAPGTITLVREEWTHARRRLPSAPSGWCRCAPARRFPGSSPSASGLRAGAAVARRLGFARSRLNACAEAAGIAQRKRPRDPLRAAGAGRTRTTRSTCTRAAASPRAPETSTTCSTPSPGSHFRAPRHGSTPCTRRPSPRRAGAAAGCATC